MSRPCIALRESRFDMHADVANEISSVHQAHAFCPTFAPQRKRAHRRFEIVLLARQDQQVEKSARQSGDRTFLARRGNLRNSHCVEVLASAAACSRGCVVYSRPRIACRTRLFMKPFTPASWQRGSDKYGPTHPTKFWDATEVGRRRTDTPARMM